MRDEESDTRYDWRDLVRSSDTLQATNTRLNSTVAAERH